MRTSMAGALFQSLMTDLAYPLMSTRTCSSAFTDSSEVVTTRETASDSVLSLPFLVCTGRASRCLITCPVSNFDFGFQSSQVNYEKCSRGRWRIGDRRSRPHLADPP